MTTTPSRLAAHVLDLRKVRSHGALESVPLQGATASFEWGSLSAVTGPSGSGKTTLFNLMAGLDRPTAGTVTIDGQDIGNLTERALTRLRRTKLALVTEDGDLVPSLSARENLLLPMTLAHRPVDRGWREAVVEAAGIGAQLSSPPSDLSPLHQQLVACARALLMQPRVLLADEPTGRLHAEDADAVLKLLEWAREVLPVAVVVFTHDPIVAASSDRAILLSNGRIVADLSAPTPVSMLSMIAELDAARRAGPES